MDPFTFVDTDTVLQEAADRLANGMITPEQYDAIDAHSEEQIQRAIHERADALAGRQSPDLAQELLGDVIDHLARRA